MTTTTTIIADRDSVTNVARISKQVQFALCSYCFWCASSLDGRLDKVCPSCKGSTIDSIPLTGTQMLVDNSTANSVE